MSLNNKFRCPLCYSKKRKVFLKNGEDFEYGVRGKFKLVKCCLCGLISLFPRPIIKKLLTFYPDSYHSYNVPTSSFIRFLSQLTLRQQAKRFEKLIGKEGKILDVGCADGKHFDVLKRFGKWQFIGIDFNPKVVKRGKNKGREIYQTALEKFKYLPGSFDLVVMDHLLEHVVDPIETLNSARLLLKKGGFLVGAVPNLSSLDRIIFGRWWGGYHFPRHVWHFTPQTLTKTLTKAGFNLKNLDYELHTGHWALSIQNFLQSKKITRTRIKQGRTFYYPWLLGMLMPINFIQKIFHFTGIISFTAQRK